MTLNLNNVEQLVAGEYEVEYNEDIFSFEGVELNNEFNDFGEEHDVQVALHEPSFDEGFSGKTVTVGATIADESFEGFSGNTDFIDLKFKVIDDEYYKDLSVLTVNDLGYKQYGDNEYTSIPVFYHDTFMLIPSKSTVNGSIHAEAFLHEEGFKIGRASCMSLIE